jgi:hypothetical protein
MRRKSALRRKKRELQILADYCHRATTIGN